MRYLSVFSKSWEVIDTECDCAVVAEGNKDEMNQECDRLNAGGSPSFTNLRESVDGQSSETPLKPKGTGNLHLVQGV